MSSPVAINSTGKPHWLVSFGMPGLLIALTFLMASPGFIDPDLWWHLRAGEWILENGRVPHLDPFTFGSADQPWIDVSWGFQILLAMTHRYGGISGILILQAGLAALGILCAYACQPRTASATITTLLWVPAVLVASHRFLMRPELLTLLCLSGYLAILSHVRDKPHRIWWLVVIQLVWANVHGLFILGPLTLGLYFTARAISILATRRMSLAECYEQRWKLAKNAAVMALVVLVCFVNPYGVDGAFFPFLLYPKVTDSANQYKQHIWEFQSPALYLLTEMNVEAQERERDSLLMGYWFHFLLLMLPLVLLPTVERLTRAGTEAPLNASRARVWLGILLTLIALAAVSAFHGVIQFSATGWTGLKFVALGVIILAGLAGCGGLQWDRRRSPGIGLSMSVAMASWWHWVERYFADPASGLPSIEWGDCLGVCTAVYLIYRLARADGDLFLVLIAGVYTYLAVNAINSLGRFGLVAGMVMAAMVGPWINELVPGMQFSIRMRIIGRVCVGVSLLAWIGAAACGWKGMPGAISQASFREAPLAFAHAAVQYAGQDRLPNRAIAFGLPVANLYVYHNAPRKQVYMDARLEVPLPSTFATYFDIEKQLLKGAPTWKDALLQLGNPVVVLSHDLYHRGEASLAHDPDWQLVYFDSLASVFVPRHAANGVPALDLAQRHFSPSVVTTESIPGAARGTAVSLTNLGTNLLRYPTATWQHRIPALLSAVDRAREAIILDESNSAPWFFMGNAYWALAAELPTRPPQSGDLWEPRSSIRWAQQTYRFQRARALSSSDARVRWELYRSCRARRLLDTSTHVGRELLQLGNLDESQVQLLRRQLREVNLPPDLSSVPSDQVKLVVIECLRRGFAETAVQMAANLPTAVRATWDWNLIDRVAAAALQLGDPERAHQLWKESPNAPSEGERTLRLAATAWVTGDLLSARQLTETAVSELPRSAAAAWQLTWICVELGDARSAIRTIDGALSIPGAIAAEIASELRQLRTFLERYVPNRPVQKLCHIVAA